MAELFHKKKIKQMRNRTNNQCCYCNCLLTKKNFTTEHIWTRLIIEQKFLIRLKSKNRTKLTVDCLGACSKCNSSRGELTDPIKYAELKKSKHIHRIKEIYERNPIELTENKIKKTKIKKFVYDQYSVIQDLDWVINKICKKIKSIKWKYFHKLNRKLKSIKLI